MLSKGKAGRTVSACLSILIVLTVLSGCASLPENSSSIESHALTDTGDTVIGQHVQRAMLGKDDALSAFYPLHNGLDALVARLALMESAQKSIDVQYYLYHDDLVGRLFLQKLLQAADRGVRVRLLLDDLSSADKDRTITVVNNHPNVEVRLFNPVMARGMLRTPSLLTDFSRTNRRMHNKSFIVDNQVAVVGGRNIGDEYFKASAVEFADLDMVLIGAATSGISHYFDEYWNYSLSYPAQTIVPGKAGDQDYQRLTVKLQKVAESAEAVKYVERLKNAPIVKDIQAGKEDWIWGMATVYADAPGKVLRPPSDREKHLLPRLGPYFEQAQAEVILISPYFVPGEEGVAFFRDLQQRGVSVTVVTNSLASTDVAVVHAGYSRYREELLEAGVQLIEMKPRLLDQKKNLTGSSQASLHAKTYIIDREIIFVGSLNLDPRSVSLNTELGVIYHSQELAERLLSNVNDAPVASYWRLKLGDKGIEWQDSQGRVVSRKDPETSWLLRLGVSLMSVLPIEDQL